MSAATKAFQPRRVLVVDDNRDHVQMLTLLLKQMGHQTEFSLTAHAALDATRRFRPDVVILDVALPDMDGTILCRQLRQEWGLQHMRILVVTGSVREGDRERAIEAGCDQFLNKPLEPRFLESLLGSVR
jgi:CheY-like chemotaxis protein